MEISINKTTASGFQKMAGFSLDTQSRHCPEHGEYQALQTPVGMSDCPRCNAQRQHEALLRQEALASERALLRRAAIPERFSDRRIDTFNAKNQRAEVAQRLVRDYANGFGEARRTGRGMILCGGVGTGKTHLAIGAIHQVTTGGFTALYAVLLDTLRSIKDTYRKDSAVTETVAMARLTAPDLLVLDEIGVQHGTDTERMLMFSILNARYNQMKPTILISNLAREPLETYLGERAFDRMREGGGRMVVFDWESYRGVRA